MNQELGSVMTNGNRLCLFFHELTNKLTNLMYEKCHLHSLREPVFVYERANVTNENQWKDFGGFPVHRYKTVFRT